MLFKLTDSPQKLDFKKIHGTLIILFYVSPSSHRLQKIFFFLLKHTHTHTHTEREREREREKERAAPIFMNCFV